MDSTTITENAVIGRDMKEMKEQIRRLEKLLEQALSRSTTESPAAPKKEEMT